MITSNQRAFALLSTTILTTVLTSIPYEAVAQSSDHVVHLDEITITARKRPERLWDVPFSVDAQTGDQLKQRRALDAASALRDVSGVSLPSFGSRSESFITIRGVAPILTPLSPDDSSVLTFVDGVPRSIGGSNSAYLDLERVEVLKGPQSTLFGRNTTGGAINLVPVAPSFTPKGYVRTEYGTANTYQLEGAVGGPIIPGILAGRLAFRTNGADGFINNVAGPKLGSDQTLAGRASLLFTPTEQTKWLVSFSADRNNSRPIFYLLGDGAKRAAQNLARDNSTQTAFNSKFEHSFDTFTFTSQTSFSTFKNDSIYNTPDFLLASALTGLPSSMFSDPRTNFSQWRKDDSRFTQEFRMTSSAESRIAWVMGAVYYQDKAKWDNGKNFWVYGPSVSGTSMYDLKTTGQALFGEVTYPVLDRLKWTVGARLAREVKTFSGDFTTDGTPGAIPYFAEGGKKTYGFWTGRTALSYEWNDQFMTYGSISRGYKTGGFGVNNSLMWAGVPRVPYDSSTVISYELGARANLLDNRLAVTGALFFNDVKKEQILGWLPGKFVAQNLNVDTQSKGFEVNAAYQITSHWDISGGVGYTHSAMRNVTAQVAASQPGLRDGNELPNVPQWTMKSSLGYRAPASEIGFSGPLASTTVFGRVSYNFIGARYTDAANLGKLDPVHLVSARLGVDWGTGEAYLFGENLLNKNYITEVGS